MYKNSNKFTCPTCGVSEFANSGTFKSSRAVSIHHKLAHGESIASEITESDWKRQREKALERDDREFQLCGVKQNELSEQLCIHHIQPFSEFGLQNHKKANQLKNLISLCRSCHSKVEWSDIDSPTPEVIR